MKAKIVFLVSVIIISIACNKGKYTTAPQLYFKSVNNTVLSSGQNNLEFTLNFTDKEGDIDSLFIKRVSKVCPNDFLNDYVEKIPNFTYTSNQKGDIYVNFSYNNIDSNKINISSCISNKNDTSSFRFCLKDKAGNYSDTLVSPQIVFLKN
jgi:hypothetical protein